MVLLYQFCPYVIKASQHSEKGGSNPPLCIAEGFYKINVGKMIEKSILGYYESNCRGLIPHPATITRLCIKGGVEEEWGTEETYPRASPLTLIGVTKGPKNRGKGKEKEMEEKKNMKGTLSYNSVKAQLQCNKKLKEVKAHSGMHP